MPTDDSLYEKKITGIFLYTLKLILVPNFSSLGWFSYSSVVNSCWQLLQKNLNGLFIYSLNVMPVPNLSSAGGLGAQLESVTDVQTDACTDARQVKIELTPTLLGWCQGLSWEILIICQAQNYHWSSQAKLRKFNWEKFQKWLPLRNVMTDWMKMSKVAVRKVGCMYAKRSEAKHYLWFSIHS